MSFLHICQSGGVGSNKRGKCSEIWTLRECSSYCKSTMVVRQIIAKRSFLSLHWHLFWGNFLPMSKDPGLQLAARQTAVSSKTKRDNREATTNVDTANYNNLVQCRWESKSMSATMHALIYKTMTYSSLICNTVIYRAEHSMHCGQRNLNSRLKLQVAMMMIHRTTCFGFCSQ